MSKKWKKAPTAIKASDPPGEFRICGESESFELQAEETPTDGKPKLRKFSMTAYTGAAMNLGGFGLPVVVDLEGMKVPSQGRPILKAHDANQIVGHTNKVEVSAQRINVAGVISGVGDAAKEVVALAANGFPWQASIGASAQRMEFVDRGETVKVNGRNFTGPLYVARSTVLGEISFVPIGADGNTSATVTASHQGKDMNFETWLTARGFNSAQITDAEKKVLKAAFDAEQKLTPPPNPAPAPPPVPAKTAAELAAEFDAEIKARQAKARAEEAAESQRVADIRARVKKHSVGEVEIEAGGKKERVNLEAHAIANGWTADQAELHALRCARPQTGPTVYTTSTPAVSEAVLEAAVLQAGRCQLWDDDFFFERGSSGERKERRVSAAQQRDIQAGMKARYTDQVQQTAHSLYRGRIGLHQVLAAGAAMNGQPVGEVIRDDGDIRRVLRAQNWIAADGATTASIANVLANVQNKFLLQGYMFTEQIWRQICGIRSVKDFKATKSISIFGDTEFDNLGPDGEMKGGAIQDQAFSNKVQNRARMLAITREHIINDDLGALTQLPMILGRGAGLKVNKIFWTMWLDTTQKDDGGTTAFWAATHTLTGGQVGLSNYISGGSSALSITSLQTAVQTFDKQVDPMGNPLGVDLSILLYPPELDETAWALLNSTLVVYGGSGSTAKQPGNNRWVNRFTPYKSRYLSNSNYTGYSTTAWWLLSDPNIIPVIEMAFLNGQEMPTVQTADAEFDKLGIQMRGFFDIGVNVQNFRGGIKSAGA